MNYLFISLVIVVVVLSLCSVQVNAFVEQMLDREGFVAHSKPKFNTTHEIIFALKQLNLDILEKEVLERATPGTSKYQQWMTFEDVGRLITNNAAFEAVTKFLSSNGIQMSWVSKRKEYVKAAAPVEIWDKLLNAQFLNFVDENPRSRIGSDTVLRTRSYEMPSELIGHVDTIFNTVQPLPIINKEYHMKAGSPYRVDFNLTNDVTSPKGLQDDDGHLVVTVQYLNEYYSIPSNIGSNSGSLGQSVFETASMSFSQTDLTQFQNTFDLTVQEAVDIGGHSIAATDCSFDSCGEGSLDIQYIMGVSQTTISTYYYVGTEDPFVTWVTDLANDADPPKSNSMSWGSIEQQLPVGILNNFNTEAMKLASIGVTVTASSGDNGVSNSGCNCQNNSGSSQSHWAGAGTWTGAGYFPNFPASNPYITAIGATMGANGFPPAIGSTEIVCQSQLDGVITSGGGFSTYFAQPSWQTSAVTSYFSELTPTEVPSPGYNKNGRGIPDMSMMGVWYQVVINGTVNGVFGTSCSSPVTAGLVSLVNAKRAAAGLTSVGYMNPTLYANAASFNDITSGINNCCENGNFSVAATCCQSGFTAATGWDPTTGLGSIDFPAFAAMFQV